MALQTVSSCTDQSVVFGISVVSKFPIHPISGRFNSQNQLTAHADAPGSVEVALSDNRDSVKVRFLSCVKGRLNERYLVGSLRSCLNGSGN